MAGTIKKRAKGSYTIWWDEGRDPLTGKRRQRNKSIKGTKRNAEAELRKILTALDSGVYIKPTKLTVGDLLRQWLENYVDVSNNVRARTGEGYHMMCEKHLIPALGSIHITQLQTAQIQSYYAQALQSGRADGKGGLSARTVKHHHRVLSEALTWAVEENLLGRNVAKSAKPPKPVSREMGTLNEDNIDLLLEAARGGQYYYLFYLATYSGMRRSELLGLRWKDVDLHLGSLSIVQTLHRLANQEIKTEAPKGAKSRRRIALGPELVLTLREHKKHQGGIRETLGNPLTGDDLVFAKPDGSPMSPSTVSHAFLDLRRKVGLEGVHLHSLRHTHATLLMKGGENPKTVQERLGHSSIAVTMDIYSHVVPGIQELAAMNFEEGLRRNRTAKEEEPARR